MKNRKNLKNNNNDMKNRKNLKNNNIKSFMEIVESNSNDDNYFDIFTTDSFKDWCELNKLDLDNDNDAMTAQNIYYDTLDRLLNYLKKYSDNARCCFLTEDSISYDLLKAMLGSFYDEKQDGIGINENLVSLDLRYNGGSLECNASFNTGHAYSSVDMINNDIDDCIAEYILNYQEVVLEDIIEDYTDNSSIDNFYDLDSDEQSIRLHEVFDNSSKEEQLDTIKQWIRYEDVSDEYSEDSNFLSALNNGDIYIKYIPFDKDEFKKLANDLLANWKKK